MRAAATSAAPLGKLCKSSFAAVEAVGDGALLDRWRTVLRAADGIEVLPDGGVRILRGGEEIDRHRAHPEEVQIRLFL